MKIKVGLTGMTLASLASLSGGTLRASDDEASVAVTALCTDSREVSPGTVFLAIKGERVDGNDFTESALQNGATAVLCERLPESGAAILVRDTVEAIGRIAGRIRLLFPRKTVAVTGSVGKTTTKDLIHAVLASSFRAHKSAGNFNSNIGMPLSVIETPENAGGSVLEMGMAGFGEIDYLSRIARPDIAVVTNIGTAHLEALGSRENIRDAKLEILNGMSPGSVILLNRDEPLLYEKAAEIREKGILPLFLSVQDRDADFFADNIRYLPGKTLFDVRKKDGVIRDLQLPLMGEHIVWAALFALAVGSILKVPEENLRSALAVFVPGPLRQNLSKIGSVTVMEDCYNASPESVRAAIDVMNTLAKVHGEHHRMVALLGDMLELGTDSEAYHRSVGEYAVRHGVECLFTFGKRSSASLADAAEEAGLPASAVFRNPDADSFEVTGAGLLKQLRPGDILLVKASRALRAERVIGYLREHENEIR